MGKKTGVKRSRSQLWLRLGAFASIMITMVSLLALLPLQQYLVSIGTWVRNHFLLGTVGFILVFWVAVPLCLPATPLEMMAGWLFGVSYGVVVITVGKTGGSTLTFLLGRSMGKALIGGYLRTKSSTFRAFADVLNSSSWKPVILYQLSSIPNLVKIYSLAVTQVSVMRFAISSAVGNIPHAILCSYIGDQVTDIAAIFTGETKITTSRMMMLITSISLTLLALAFLVVYTKRQLLELQKHQRRSSSEEEDRLLSIEVDGATPTNSVYPSTSVGDEQLPALALYKSDTQQLSTRTK